MKRIAKFFLWLTTLVVPVFIAACYGAPQSYRRDDRVDPGPHGRITDAQTKKPISGIKIQCLSEGQIRFSTRSMPDGTFRLFDSGACDTLDLKDSDGQANGGSYQGSQIPYRATMGQVRIELKPGDSTEQS